MKRNAITVSVIAFLFFAAISNSDEHNPHRNTTVSNTNHFVLVHGSCFGAWSWFKLVRLLKSAGHTVTSIDLAASGINLLHAKDVQSFSDYSKPLMDFMESIPSHQRVVLVGHSSGGTVISQAMEHFPHKVSVGVFLCSVMPGPSFNSSAIAKMVMGRLAHALDNTFTYDKGFNNPPTAFIFGPKFLSQVVFQYSPHEDVDLATVLVRPKPLVSVDGLVLTKAKFGSVRRVLISAEQDKIVTQDVIKEILVKNPPNKFFKIRNSDHMAMVSQPTQLCAHLLTIARDYL
ncbi:unnamed protein product [Amaranthus hypochondriacus]